jgi:hypothetical protein
MGKKLTKKDKKNLSLIKSIKTLSVKKGEILLIQLPSEGINQAILSGIRDSFRNLFKDESTRVAVFAGEINIRKVKFTDIGLDVGTGASNGKSTTEGTEGQLTQKGSSGPTQGQPTS